MEQLKTVPARIKVASIVRKAILSGEIIAGEQLSLTDMAEKLGISRTPVREAFQTLASEGLIELRMNKGAVVKPIDREFITDHYEMRMLLEGEAVARAINNAMDPSPVEKLQKEISLEKDLTDGVVYEKYNMEFHTSIWTAAKSLKLYNFCETLWNGPSYSRAVPENEHRQKSIAEHEVIVSLIARGEAENGRSAMIFHIRRSMNNILAGFQMQ